MGIEKAEKLDGVHDISEIENVVFKLSKNELDETVEAFNFS